LLLHETVEFEPVGASAVTGAAFGHAHQEAFAQSAGLARRPVLFVDDALAAVLALWYHRQVVVRSPEERLEKTKKRKIQIQFTKNCLLRRLFSHFQHRHTWEISANVDDWMTLCSVTWRQCFIQICTTRTTARRRRKKFLVSPFFPSWAWPIDHLRVAVYRPNEPKECWLLSKSSNSWPAKSSPAKTKNSQSRFTVLY
jgi:hypothetical protein